MNKWIAPVLVGISVLIVGGIAYFLTRPPSYMNTYVSNTYISLTKAEPQPPVRQSPRQSSIPCEAICPECNKIIRGKIIRSNIEGDYCWIPLHKDDLSDENCRYTGSDITL